MPSSPGPRPLVAIVGPTGVGKTGLSLALAQRFQAEVVNADSRQVYRGMDIGTAKPTPQERAQVPHHLFDLLEPWQECSLALWRAAARDAVAAVHARRRLPLLVGGTGQYVWAFLEGWEAPPVPPQRELRRRLEEQARAQGAEVLYAELHRVDPEAAARIGPRNVRRLVRALEVWHATGQPFSRQRRREPPPYRTLVLGLTMPRAELYARLDARTDAMLAQGWLQEVRRLLNAGVPPAAPSFGSIGYRELAAHLRGELPLEEAVARIKAATHRLVRHQYAWFRLRDPRIAWLQAGHGVEERAAALVERFLASP